MTTGNGRLPTKKSSTSEVEAFLKKVVSTPTTTAPGECGRLIFALDATASRQPTWDRAAQIQGEMFSETANLGGLEVQLAFYRGFGEFRVGPWLSESSEMLRMMSSVYCMAGETQIRKVLSHAINDTKKKRVNALVFVGDCVEEDIDRLGALAGELGLLGVPAFMFHEGMEPVAEYAFKEIARLTNGACCRFDASSPNVLKELLSAVAVYAAGGRAALEDFAKKRGGEILQIAHQVRGG